MVVVKWKIHDYEEPVDEQEAYNLMNLVRYNDKYILIEVFIEHEYTVLETYFKSPHKLRLEEIVDVESSALARKPFKKSGLKKEKETRDHDVSESNEEDVNEDETISESNEEAANEDETVSESHESDESQGSDYIVDEDNLINGVNVDMQEFYQNINKDVEWVGCTKGKLEGLAQMNLKEGYDLDDFDMDIDCDSDVESSKKRKKGLRALRKESKNKGGHFYVSQEFADKKEATTLVTCQAVATRRYLYVWKNDKVRLRAVCRGKCPDFTNLVGPNAIGLSSPSKGNLKQVNGKWVKSKRDETSGSGQGINKVDGIRIKVGGKNGSYVYDTITCPWSLQISKENNTWTVKTYKDEHTCLQTREVRLLTDKWLSNEIEDIVKPNPNILVKALKEQLQKKYHVGISIGKVKRAKAASIMTVKSDFSEQYSLLRDYVLELQRRNEDTTVKIDFNRDYNPSETTRHFKRIYGQYPGQLLTAVGIDANHGIYHGILPAIAQVFPCAEHRQMEKLKSLDEGAYEYLKKIPPQHWSRSHFSGSANCDVLLNNLWEVFNRQLMDGREVPIIICLEFVREYLMKRIVNVKKSPGPLTPAAIKLFEAIKYKVAFYTVLWNGGTKYQANGPYEDQHAVAVINDMAITNADVGVPQSWVHSSY
ncbi:hypothetical protein Tco_0844013 [Tanacetum coccineum]